MTVSLTSIPQVIRDAFNNYDKDQLDRIFTDDTVVEIHLPSPLPTYLCDGEDLLRYYKNFFQAGFHMETESPTISVNNVTWLSWISCNALMKEIGLGVDIVEIKSEASLRDMPQGKIIGTLSITLAAGEKLKSILTLYLEPNLSFTKKTQIITELIAGHKRLQLPKFCGRRANLSYINLRNCYLLDANLNDANLRNARLYDVMLDRAKLNGAILQEARLENITFTRVELQVANLVEADFRACLVSKRVGLGGAESAPFTRGTASREPFLGGGFFGLRSVPTKQSPQKGPPRTPENAKRLNPHLYQTGS
jgi:hypothetical protein